MTHASFPTLLFCRLASCNFCTFSGLGNLSRSLSFASVTLDSSMASQFSLSLSARRSPTCSPQLNCSYLFSCQNCEPPASISLVPSGSRLSASVNCSRSNQIQSLRFPLAQTPQTSASPRSVTVRSFVNVNSPIVLPNDQWGIWTALFASGAFGIW